MGSAYFSCSGDGDRRGRHSEFLRIHAVQRIRRENITPLILFGTFAWRSCHRRWKLVLIFIALEISSISSYVLTGFRQHEAASAEASLKYFLLGSFATAFFLYGVALLLGHGIDEIDQISAALRAGPIPLLAFVAVAFMFVGLGFKVAAAPFQSGLLTCMKERGRDCGLDVNGAEGGGICGIVAHCFRNQCAGDFG